MRPHYVLPVLLAIVICAPTSYKKRDFGIPMDGSCGEPNPTKQGGVYLCSEPNFSGRGSCMLPAETSKCFVPDFVPKSIGPEPGTYCVTWSNKECKDDPMTYMYFISSIS
ncbi:hypothetical protein EK21DRAFT_87936 [Setomelanomma holmii]|uniref:Secreted protein n=1 Tax=Setomelanomma holmii TaxID=210430 RepID=A0A9P4HCQ9_9PLEO|nr:hypothetical protein EK21DRAFT_87936 [Setomelanomma holmii]